MLLLWNWQLVIATLAGVTVMGIAYLAQDWDWQHFVFGLRRSFNAPTQKFTLAAASRSRYRVAGIYHADDLDGGGKSLASIGVGIAVNCHACRYWCLLPSKHLSNWLGQERESIERFVYMLAAPDDLERLIAVRQLAQAVQQNRFSLSQERAIAEYCQVLLDRETVPGVRDAALETLESLNYPHLTNSLHSTSTTHNHKIPCNIPETIANHNSNHQEIEIKGVTMPASDQNNYLQDESNLV
jgi:hypothetical protein